MKISKKDALLWFDFLSQLSDEDEITSVHEEIIYSVFAQIEAAVENRNEKLIEEIKNLKKDFLHRKRK